MTYRQLLEKCIARLEKMSERNVLSGLGDLLSDERKKWAKTTLRTGTIFLLKLALENTQQSASLSLRRIPRTPVYPPLP